MIIYNTENPPKSGNGRKIYNALVQAGFSIADLHYNGNSWGKGQAQGYGTWAVQFHAVPTGWSIGSDGCWCGIREGRVYLEGTAAPYNVYWV